MWRSPSVTCRPLLSKGWVCVEWSHCRNIWFQCRLPDINLALEDWGTEVKINPTLLPHSPLLSSPLWPCVTVWHQPSPVRPRALWRQLHAVHRVVAVIVHDLGQTEVSDLDLPAGRAVHQEDVTCRGRDGELSHTGTFLTAKQEAILIGCQWGTTTTWRVFCIWALTFILSSSDIVL